MDWDRGAELLRVSVEALNRYRLRTALSALGIVLGIAAVIAMLSVGEGAREDVLRQVEQLGLDNVIVRSRGFGGDSRLRLEDADLLGEALPQVVAASPLVERFIVVSGPLATRRASLLGVTAAYASILDLDVDSGRFLAPLDRYAAGPVCVLGAQPSASSCSDTGTRSRSR